MTESQKEQPVHLHLEQVDGLVTAAGADGALAILDAFKRSTSDLLKSIESDLINNALSEASRTAHAIKGSAANVGAGALADAAAAIETACKDGDQNAALAKMNDVKALYVAYCDAFKAHIERF